MRKARTKALVTKKQGVESGVVFSGPVKLVKSQDWLESPRDWSSGYESDVPQPYSRHAWVYAAVRAIGTNIAQVPLQINGGPVKNPTVYTALDESDTSAGAQLARVLDRPNAHMSGGQLIEATCGYLNLCGDCAWILDRENVAEVPRQIVPVSGHLLRGVFSPPVMDYGSSLLGWVYQSPTGEMVALRQEQVLFFRFWNPDDSVYGLAPLSAARFGIKLDYLAAIYSAGFFANSADPAGVITAPKRLSLKQQREIRDFWEERHRGPGNAKRVGVLYGGMDFKAISVPQKDMEFVEQRRMTRDEILAVFKVPKSEVSLYEDINMATAVTQDRSFWNKTLVPIIRLIEAVMRARLVPGLRPLIDQQLRIFFDLKTVPALQESLTEKILNAEKLIRMGYPLNVVNEILEMGFPSVAWGDTWYVNKAILPIEIVLEEGTTKSAKPSGRDVDAPDGQPEDDPDAPDDDEGNVDEPEDDSEDDSEDEEQAVYGSIATEYSVRLKDSLHGYFRRLRAKQLSAMVRDRSLFSLDEALGKLLERVDSIVNSAVAELTERLGRPCVVRTDEPNYPETLLRYLRERLGQVCSVADDEEALQKVREVFNRTLTDQALLIIAKLEIVRRTRR